MDTKEKIGLITVLPSTVPIVPTLSVIPMVAESTLRSQKATVTVLDQNNNPISGVTVNTSVEGQLVTVVPTTAVTNDNGIADFDFRFGLLTINGKITFSVGSFTTTITTQ